MLYLELLLSLRLKSSWFWLDFVTQKRTTNVLALPLPRSHGNGSKARLRSEVIDETSFSEHFFREMIDNALQGIVVHREQKALYVNHAWAELFGVSVDDVMAMPSIGTLFYEEDRKRVCRYATDRLAGREAPNRYRFRIKRPSGQLIWAEVFVRQINWRGSEACQCTVIDVDDQEQQAASLRQVHASMERQAQERSQVLEKTNSQLHLYEAIINQMSDRISVIGTDYRFRMTNKANLQYRKRSLDEVIGVHLRETIGGRLFDNIGKPMLDRCFSGEADHVVEPAVDFPDGNERQLDIIGEPFRDPDGTIGGAILSIRDVTEAKRIEEQLRLYASAVDQVSDRISVVGTDYRYRMTNKANLDYHQKPLEAFLGQRVADILGESYFLKHSKPDLDRCIAGETVKSLRAVHDRTGNPQTLEIILEPYRDADGTISGAVTTLRDVTEANRLSERLAYQASHDVLTGLVNRQAFEQHLKQAIQETANNSRSAVFCFIDLDQFKIINDTVGHLVGDQLLQQVAKLLDDKIHAGDVLARLGGDEFGLLLQGCSLRRAERAAENLVAALNDYRFFHEGHVFEVSASIGITVINRHTQDVGEVMSQADLACYAAKDHGRNRVHIYKKRDAFLRRRREEMHQAGGIRAALDQEQFELFAQPIKQVCCDDAIKPDRLEILLRMKGDGSQPIMPSSFIPAAERYGFMGEIDRWVIKRTIAYLATSSMGARSLRFNINISGVTLNDDTLLEFICNVLRKADVSAHQVCFEITETAAIRNLVKTEAFIQELRASGSEFALDDFGSGLSSLNYLKRLPVDYLKIDRTFIRDICEDDNSRAMVAAIHQMANALGIKTVAEGVEDMMTLRVLEDLHIDYVQGFEVGMPKPLESFLS